MKALLALLFLVSLSQAHSETQNKFYPSVNLLNGQISFDGKSGVGSIEQANYKVSKSVELSHQKLNFDLKLNNGKVSINDIENKVILTPGFNLDFLLGADLLINTASFDSDKADLKSESGEVLLKDQRIQYKNLRFGSEFKLIKRTQNELPIKKGDIYFSKLNLKISKVVKEIFLDLMSQDKMFSVLAVYLNSDYYDLFSGAIHLNDGHFWGQAWLDKMINIKIKFDAHITLENQDQILVIDVNKIKASILSIKGKVLKAIKNANIKNVVVDGDKIKIFLKK